MANFYIRTNGTKGIIGVTTDKRLRDYWISLPQANVYKAIADNIQQALADAVRFGWVAYGMHVAYQCWFVDWTKNVKVTYQFAQPEKGQFNKVVPVEFRPSRIPLEWGIC